MIHYKKENLTRKETYLKFQIKHLKYLIYFAILFIFVNIKKKNLMFIYLT